MKNYRVLAGIGDFSFCVQAENEEDAMEEAKNELSHFVAVIQDVASDFEETLSMWIADIEEEDE
jgi:hypothetical protein